MFEKTCHATQLKNSVYTMYRKILILPGRIFIVVRSKTLIKTVKPRKLIFYSLEDPFGPPYIWTRKYCPQNLKFSFKAQLCLPNWNYIKSEFGEWIMDKN